MSVLPMRLMPSSIAPATQARSLTRSASGARSLGHAHALHEALQVRVDLLGRGFRIVAKLRLHRVKAAPLCFGGSRRRCECACHDEHDKGCSVDPEGGRLGVGSPFVGIHGGGNLLYPARLIAGLSV